ncbi:MAG: N-acetylglucosamine-6-phosphate deacetylase [Pleomorphochaeta sp.]
MIIKNAKIFHESKWLNGSVEFNTTINSISSCEIESNNDTIIDAQGMYLLPGFIDVHTHGAINIDVNHIQNTKEVNKLSLFYASHGTTSFLSSIMSDSIENTERVINVLNRSIDESCEGAKLLGIHLEGPFISKEYKGAMDERYLKDADSSLLNHYIELSNNNIKYITVAPEVKNVNDLVKKYSDKIVFSIGHSGASYQLCISAIDNGANSITHMYNAMKLFHQHYPSVVGAALESDVYCEAICDGFHLVPATVRLLLKVKGLDRIVAVSDSMMAAGLNEGPYKLGPNTVVVENGDAKLLDGVRAGSTLTQDIALKNLIKFTNKPLEKLLPLFTRNPAQMLNIYDKKGSISINKDADFVLINKDYEIEKTIVNGKIVFDKNDIN